jgi:hypothetical protein
MEPSKPKNEYSIIEAKLMIRGRPAREGDKNRVGVPVAIIPPRLPQATQDSRSVPSSQVAPRELELAADYLSRLMLYLRKQRELHGMSLADVAAKSGLDRGMLCKLEKGRIPNPTFLTLWRYARALEDPPAQIVLAACRSAAEAEPGGAPPVSVETAP